MARVYVFADEAGNFDFSSNRGASKYFVLGTMTLRDPSLGTSLVQLRRDLAWRGHGLETSFHAAKDRLEVKDAVFSLLESSDFRFDAVVLEKSKAPAHLRGDWEHFYETAWILHFSLVAPSILRRGDDLMVTAASIGTRKRRSSLRTKITPRPTSRVGGRTRGALLASLRVSTWYSDGKSQASRRGQTQANRS